MAASALMDSWGWKELVVANNHWQWSDSVNMYDGGDTGVFETPRPLHDT
jgi:hypothetical protein